MPETEHYEIAVIGGGPGGYVAAVRAAQLGFETVLIEKCDTLGGTCLNVGCIPSKALLESSERFYEARHAMLEHGIATGEVTLDLATMLGRKDTIVSGITKGVEFLMHENGVTVLTGTGTLAGDGAITITNDNGSETEISADDIIIATGSHPTELPPIPFDHDRVIDSTDALALDAVPEHLVVIGAGAIGLEMASVWARLGAQVTVLEMMPQILPGWDSKIAATLSHSLQKQGITIHTKTTVKEWKATDAGVSITAIPEGGEPLLLDGSKILVAIGRRPHTETLGLETAGVETDARGFITVGKRFETSVANIHAIGDVVGQPMLAHKAEAEAISVVEQLAGSPPPLRPNMIPGIVYTHPEAAMVGQTPEALTAQGTAFNTGTFQFRANGRAQAAGATDGFVTVLADAASDRVLGVHMVGPSASELIAEAVLVMEFDGCAEDLARTVHGHPTLSEVTMEAALGVGGRSIHAPPKRT